MNSSIWSLGDSDNSYGQQSLINDTDGSKIYRIKDTITNKLGNWFGSVDKTPTNHSQLRANTTNTCNYGDWISITYQAKAMPSVTEARIYPRGCQKGHPLDTNVWVSGGSKVRYKYTYNMRNKPDKIYIEREDGRPIVGIDDNSAIIINIGSSMHYNCKWVRYHANGQYLTVWENESWSGADSNYFPVWNAGDYVKGYNEASVGFNARNPINDGQWHTYSNNAQCKTLPESWYDYSTKGIGIDFSNLVAGGDMYIRRVKFGRASKVEVKRDNSALVYSGYGSDVTDTGLVVKPETPTLVDMQTLESSINMKLHANTHTEQHSYKARSLGSSGNNPSTWSRAYNVTLTSTPSKYIAKLYKNGTPILDGDMPTDWTYSDVKRGDKITGQVWTVDTEGQKSETPLQINYTVKQTLADYKKDVKKLEDDSNKVAKSYSYEERLNIKGKVTKAAEDLMTNLNLRSHKANVTINNRKENETEFEAGEKLVNIYVN